MSAAGSALVPASEPAAQASDQITGLAVASTPGAAHVAAGQAAIAGKGMTAVRDPAIYRGLATAEPVRERSCMQGLLPRLQASLQQEIDRAAQAIERCCSPLEKFQALTTLRETNQAAFYGLLSQDLTTYLPLIYTPTVGEACQRWGQLLQRPTGLYISIKDQANCAQ